MSPNVRASNKKPYCVYVDAKLLKQFKNACERLGTPMSIAVTNFMKEIVYEHKQAFKISEIDHLNDLENPII